MDINKALAVIDDSIQNDKMIDNKTLDEIGSLLRELEGQRDAAVRHARHCDATVGQAVQALRNRDVKHVHSFDVDNVLQLVKSIQALDPK